MNSGAPASRAPAAPAARFLAGPDRTDRAKRTNPTGTAAVPAAADDFLLRYATLSPQQCRVLGMLEEGLLNKQIAGVLGITPGLLFVRAR